MNKQAPAEGRTPSNRQTPWRRRRICQGGVLLAAIVLIGIGIYTQDYLNVLHKAIRMCMECMGL